MPAPGTKGCKEQQNLLDCPRKDKKHAEATEWLSERLILPEQREESTVGRASCLLGRAGMLQGTRHTCFHAQPLEARTTPHKAVPRWCCGWSECKSCWRLLWAQPLCPPAGPSQPAAVESRGRREALQQGRACTWWDIRDNVSQGMAQPGTRDHLSLIHI